MEIFNWLNDIKIVSRFNILSYTEWESGFYYKIEIEIINKTLLFAKEYSDINERNYSFHWQEESGKLIIRWDNAPHHKSLKRFPFHKHVAEKVEESNEMTLKEAIKYIENLIS
jgi:hypothetical protein